MKKFHETTTTTRHFELNKYIIKLNFIFVGMSVARVCVWICFYAGDESVMAMKIVLEGGDSWVFLLLVRATCMTQQKQGKIRETRLVFDMV